MFPGISSAITRPNSPSKSLGRNRPAWTGRSATRRCSTWPSRPGPMGARSKTLRIRRSCTAVTPRHLCQLFLIVIKLYSPRGTFGSIATLTEVSGFELETAGVLKAGRKFWALAHRQGDRTQGNDRVAGYLLLTSCDGTLATTATPTTIRVVCNNTLSAVPLNGKSSSAIKVPHRTSFDAMAVEEATLALPCVALPKTLCTTYEDAVRAEGSKNTRR